MSVHELEAAIMRLEPREQSYLFDKLLHALEAEQELLTKEELDRRSDDLLSGRVQGVSPEEMMSSARRLL